MLEPELVAGSIIDVRVVYSTSISKLRKYSFLPPSFPAMKRMYHRLTIPNDSTSFFCLANDDRSRHHFPRHFPKAQPAITVEIATSLSTRLRLLRRITITSTPLLTIFHKDFVSPSMDSLGYSFRTAVHSPPFS